jgi:hypothetical protein
VTIKDGNAYGTASGTKELKAALAAAQADCRRRGGQWASTATADIASPGMFQAGAGFGACMGGVHGDLGAGNIYTTGAAIPTADAVKADAAGVSSPVVDHFRAMCSGMGKTIAWRNGQPVGCK